MAFTIVQWNAQIFFAHRPSFSQYLRIFHSLPQILWILKIWFQSHYVFIIGCYASVSQYKPSDIDRGGCAIYTQNSLSDTSLNFSRSHKPIAVLANVQGNKITSISIYSREPQLQLSGSQTFLEIIQFPLFFFVNSYSSRMHSTGVYTLFLPTLFGVLSDLYICFTWSKWKSVGPESPVAKPPTLYATKLPGIFYVPCQGELAQSWAAGLKPLPTDCATRSKSTSEHLMVLNHLLRHVLLHSICMLLIIVKMLD